MTSKIVVNNIESDSGINTVTIIGDVSVGSSITATDITATHHGSGADLTNLPAANLTGTLPALDGSALTGVGVGTADSINTSGIITATTFVPTVGQLSHRNIIINGAMMVSQRGTSNTAGGDGYYTVDRIRYYNQGIDNDVTKEQVDVASGTTPYTLGFRKAFKITNGNQTSGAGAADIIEFMYRVEAQDIANSGWNYTSSASFVTLSFWCKSSVAQNFNFFVKAQDGTAQSFPYETGSLTADTWTKVTKTIPGNSNLTFNNDTGEGIRLDFPLFYGTDFTGSTNLNQWNTFSGGTRTPDHTSTWYTTNDATFEITGLQLEVGSVATPFEHRSFGDELARCQRYYFRRTGGNGDQMCLGYAESADRFAFMVNYPVPMRQNPSFNGSATTVRFYANNPSQTFTMNQLVVFQQPTTPNPEQGALWREGTSGATAGQGGALQTYDSSTSTMEFSAEL